MQTGGGAVFVNTGCFQTTIQTLLHPSVPHLPSPPRSRHTEAPAPPPTSRVAGSIQTQLTALDRIYTA